MSLNKNFEAEMLAKLEALEAEEESVRIRDAEAQIEAEIIASYYARPSKRTEHQLEMRRQRKKRARAKKKALKLLVERENKLVGIVKERFYRTPRSSVIIKKPIEAVDRFKRIEVND